MTLLEVAIAVSILAAAFGGMLMSLGTGRNAFRQSVSNTRLHSSSARVMQRVLKELMPAAEASLWPQDPDGGDALTFQTVVDVVGGAPVLGDACVLRSELSPVELDNGLDDDGNGLVDERVIVLLTDFGGANERRMVLVRNVREFLEGEDDNGLDDNANGLVDEAGLSFDMESGSLTVRISVQSAVGAWEPQTETLEGTLTLRN